MAKKSVKYYFHYLYILSDLAIVFAVALLSFYLPGRETFLHNLNFKMIYAACLSVFTAIVFIFFKVYKMFTSEIGIFEMIKLIVLTFVTQMVGFLVIALVKELPEARWYILPFIPSLSTTILFVLLSRVFIRVTTILRNMRRKKEKVRTLVIGAGSAGKIVIDESRKNIDNHNFVVAFVDDDINKIGATFSNLPVEGPINRIGEFINRYRAEEVIIAISELSQERMHKILSYLNDSPVRVRRLPTLSEMEGPNDRRIVDVDLDDILSRDPVVLDNHEVNDMLKDKCVLITGAGGSIGSELTRQIFDTHPKTLILFDIYENSTYEIQMELTRRIMAEKINIDLVTLIGSTYDENRVDYIIKKYRPDYIYHAAAYKHVPLMEDSPAEAIRTNVIGTYNVAKAADKYGVSKMVLVSTDKAVRPTNVMGATKRFAETIIQYYSEHSKHTKYAAVRFGNVLGSNGSVVPLFKKQIEAGGPITITNMEIIRYFMTIPEAVSLILQCGLFAEKGEIFILDMGNPVKIYHLAERLIRQAGLVPGKDIQIVETGLRPGEKLYEELLLDKTKQTSTSNEKIFVEPAEMVNEKVLDDIAKASTAFGLEETRDIKKLLASLIKTYTISE